MSNYLQKIIYLSQSDYEILANGGSITYGNRTLQGLEPDYIYITDNVILPHKLTFGAGGAFVYDGSEDVTVPVYTGSIL